MVFKDRAITLTEIINSDIARKDPWTLHRYFLYRTLILGTWMPYVDWQQEYPAVVDLYTAGQDLIKKNGYYVNARTCYAWDTESAMMFKNSANDIIFLGQVDNKICCGLELMTVPTMYKDGCMLGGINLILLPEPDDAEVASFK
jgi:hypothetical protein